MTIKLRWRVTITPIVCSHPKDLEKLEGFAVGSTFAAYTPIRCIPAGNVGQKRSSAFSLKQPFS